MRRIATRLFIGILTFAAGSYLVALWVMGRAQPTPGARPQPVAQTPTATVPGEAVPNAVPDTPIRSTDFANFTYPKHPDLMSAGERRKTFTLKDGNFEGSKNEVGMRLYKCSYGDVTGDGEEDAILQLGVDTSGGSAIISAVYIYTWRDNGAKFLWSFVSGDRADGGLRAVYATGGELVVELEGKDKIIGTDLFADDGTSSGDCCATLFTRSRYGCKGKRFRQQGKAEVLPITPSPLTQHP